MSIWGQLSTFGLSSVLRQGYEKLAVDHRRFSHLHGRDIPTVFRPPLAGNTGAPAPTSIFLVTQGYFPEMHGGTEQFVRHLAAGLQHQGSYVVIFAYSAEKPSCYPQRIGNILYREDRVDGVTVIRFRHQKPPFDLLKDLGDDGTAESFFSCFLQIYAPQLVHFAHLRFVGGLAGSCVRNGVPYVVTLTDFFPLCHFSTRIDPTGRLCPGCQQGKGCGASCPEQRVRDSDGRYAYAAQILRAAQGVAAPSSYVASVYEREMPGLPISVIPHGVMPISAVQRQGAVRRFAYVGSISESKGVFRLVKAFASLPDTCRLEIYGGGNRASVTRLRRMLKSNSHMQYAGSIPHEKLGAVYQRTDCVVVPSLVPETYNFVVREGLQSGCLVVGSDLGAIPEAISPGKNGFLFSLDSTDALEDALKQAVGFSWATYQKKQLPTQEGERLCYQQFYLKIV